MKQDLILSGLSVALIIFVVLFIWWRIRKTSFNEPDLVFVVRNNDGALMGIWREQEPALGWIGSAEGGHDEYYCDGIALID